MTVKQRARPKELSDEDLMRRVQADDLRAFEELFDRFSAEAFGLARAMCGGSYGGEEALQEGFLAIWSSRSSFDPARGSVRAWLFTVIRRRAVDQMRRDQNTRTLRASDEQIDRLWAPGSIAAQAEGQDEGRRLRGLLGALPRAQREVITLAYFGGLTHTEIAARLQIPAGTVKGRLRLGLHRVRTEINPSLASDRHDPQPDTTTLSVAVTQ